MEELSGDEEDFSDEEDEEMPADDEGPDHSMTLVQYQEEVRRDALIRKGFHVTETSPKKGRVKAEGSQS